MVCLKTLQLLSVSTKIYKTYWCKMAVTARSQPHSPQRPSRIPGQTEFSQTGDKKETSSYKESVPNCAYYKKRGHVISECFSFS